jgi:hypothetical protein
VVMQKVDSRAAFDSSAVGSPPSLGTIGTGTAPFVDLGPTGAMGRARRAVASLSDRQLAAVLGTVLFALAAWPLVLTPVPPFQDLPNHLAAITVIDHPASYPEFVSNGFLKTNAALFTWLYFSSKVMPVLLGAKIFTLVAFALNAMVLPRLVLDLTGSRKRMVVATFFAWPMVHNWFVSMGMLDFALGVPLSLWLLLGLHHHSRAASFSWPRSVGLMLLACATWYAHAFALLVVHMLLVIHVATQASWRARFQQAVRVLLPIAPASLMLTVSLYDHWTEPQGAMQGFMRLSRTLPVWELFYHLWAEYLWAFTKLEITSFVPGVGLALIGWFCRKEKVPFFGPFAFLVVGAMYFLMPYTATNWFHVNSRFIPYFFLFALVRVPAQLPHAKKVLGLLGLSAALYSLGLGVDYIRLERDRQKFVAGIPYVPQNSQLLPLLFTRQITSENTRSLLHAWGFYVMEKQTAAPLLFAHSRSFPVMYSDPPPDVQFNHLLLESFAPTMGTEEGNCTRLRDTGVYSDCHAPWVSGWAEFWSKALPKYDHVLMWDPTPEAYALVPPQYHVKFKQDRLTIFERVAER